MRAKPEKSPVLRAAIKAMEKAEAAGFSRFTIMDVLLRREFDDGAKLVGVEDMYLSCAMENRNPNPNGRVYHPAPDKPPF